MPESENPTQREEEKWISLGGKKIRVDTDEEAEDKARERNPSVRGEKEKNTKEALSKTLVKRYDLIKSIFNIRDEVVFDEYKKSGIVSGLDGQNVKIFDGRDIQTINKNEVFKKSELLDGTHWDTMSKEYKLYYVEKMGINQAYINRDWMEIQKAVRDVILKTASPAGYDSSTSGSSNPIYNPINDNKTVSERIKEEEAKQKEVDIDDTKSSTD